MLPVIIITEEDHVSTLRLVIISNLTLILMRVEMQDHMDMAEFQFMLDMMEFRLRLSVLKVLKPIPTLDR